MKIRNGFVSNSSSSSFILIGYDVSDMKFEEDVEEYLHEGHDGVIYIAEGKTQYMGVGFQIGDCDVFGDNIIDLIDFLKQLEPIRSKYNIPKQRTVKVFTGTRGC